MNTTFPHAYSNGVTVLVTMYQNLGAAEFGAVELNNAAEAAWDVGFVFVVACAVESSEFARWLR